MAGRFEYWSAVYTVGLDGLSDEDHLEMNAFAEEGWEPVLMTAVHGGFGTLVLFRREAKVVTRPAPVKKTTAAKKGGSGTKASASKRATAAKRA